MKTIRDIVELNGFFTPGVLMAQGFSSDVVIEAQRVGLLVPYAGSLKTIERHHRAHRMEAVFDRFLENSRLAPGMRVSHNENGISVPCVVTAVNGTTITMVSEDGKNQTYTASESELAALPSDPEAAKKQAAVDKQAPAVAQKPETVSHPLG